MYSKITYMNELIIIRTENSEKVKDFLNREQISYEVFYEKEDELAREYQEAWKDPKRIAEAKQWEQAAMNDWFERAKKLERREI